MPRGDTQQLIAALEKHAAALAKNTATLEKSMRMAGGAGAGVGGGRGAPALPGGRPAPGAPRGGGAGLLGRLGGLGGIARAIPGLAAAAAGTAVVGAAGKVAGAGAISALQGGDFASGAARSIVGLAAKIPFLGEATGAAALDRTLQGTESDLAGRTREVDRILGPNALDQQFREQLARQQAVYNANEEVGRQRNAIATNRAQTTAAAALYAANPAGNMIYHMVQSAGLGMNQ